MLDKSLVTYHDQIHPLFKSFEITQLIGSSAGIVFEQVRWQEQRAPTAFFLLNSISGSVCPARVGLTSAESKSAGSERVAARMRMPRGRRDARKALRTAARLGMLLLSHHDLVRPCLDLPPVAGRRRPRQVIRSHVPRGWVQTTRVGKSPKEPASGYCSVLTSNGFSTKVTSSCSCS